MGDKMDKDLFAHNSMGKDISRYPHKPVLLDAVTDYIVTDPCGIYADCTAGSGGHGEAILKRLAPEGRLLCLDQDPNAITFIKERFADFNDQVRIIQAPFADLPGVLVLLGIKKVNGLLMDLGMSSWQIDYSGRGFSFMRNEPLDMRMNPENKISAKDLLGNIPERELSALIKNYGEEKKAKYIAKAIVKERGIRPIETTEHLRNIIETVVPYRINGKNPATKTFQAIRIAVNNELEQIEKILSRVPDLLISGGRIAVLSYHSLEDRLIKQTMIEWERGCSCPKNLAKCMCGFTARMKRIFLKGIKPDSSEIQKNSRSRSAILRVSAKL